MKKLLTLCLMALTTSAIADYTFVVPQKPGGGTSVWAQIIAEQLVPFLGENIVILHQPGARDIPGFNTWHNDLRDNDKIIMVSHGGNGVAFLQENVDYNYGDYESIGLMNLNIIAGKTFRAFMLFSTPLTDQPFSRHLDKKYPVPQPTSKILIGFLMYQNRKYHMI